MATRTQEEILARYSEVKSDDMFDFRWEVLAASMDADSLRAACAEYGFELSEAAFAGPPATPPEKLADVARDYLAFAIGKILDHRGISATRSVIKLTEFAWLLGRDDVVSAMEAADYAQYGAPQVKAFAEGMGWLFLDGRGGDQQAELERMAAGDPCHDGCEDGCGS